MKDLYIKQELMADRSSPTIPNTSSRAQTISSAAATPPVQAQMQMTEDLDTTPFAQTQTQTQMTDDSDTTMGGAGNGSPSILKDAIEFLGAHSRRLIQGIKKLDTLDIDTTLQLPKFVVVGDQSAGKSSIVEALCDISLPRSQGTCTRCPFLITTSSQAPSNGAAWACSISIQQGFYYHTERNGSGQFFQRGGPKMVDHFATVTNKSELEPMLRRAQLAVLNPRDDPQTFVGIELASATMPRQVPFSPNVVCLEIQGPSLPELYFYDLPGSINVIEDDEDPGLVKWIEKLVTDYIRNEKCLILLACGADQDVETSTTFRFIKDCQATKRCAGVLTKADLLPPGKIQYVKQILSDKKFTLGNGWFITKQLSQAQIDQGITHHGARELEARFFEQSPWMSLANLQRRFGIERLQEVMSQLIVDRIREEVPHILNRVATKLDEVNSQLTFFPESPPHPAFAVASDIQKLASALASHLKGDGDKNPFRQDWHNIIEKFRKQLSSTKPSVDFKTPGYVAPSISLDSDSEPETPTPVRVAIRSSATPRPSAPTPQRANVTPSSARKRPVDEATPQARRTKVDPATPSVTQKSFTLEYLQSEYEKGNTSGVPNSANPKVTDRLILESLDWKIPVDRLLKDCTNALTAMVTNSIDDIIKNKQISLYTHTQEELAAFVASLMHLSGDRIEFLLRCEQERPHVYGDTWKPARAARLRGLQTRRNAQRVAEHFDTIEAATPKIKPVTAEKRAEKANDAAWIIQTLGPDEWATEIECLATILCYYDNAVMCFVNTVAKNLEFGVLRPLRETTAQTLFDGLRAGDSAACAELLAEDPAREKQRVELLAEKARLEKAAAEVSALCKE